MSNANLRRLMALATADSLSSRARAATKIAGWYGNATLVVTSSNDMNANLVDDWRYPLLFQIGWRCNK